MSWSCALLAVALAWQNGPSGDAATDDDHPTCDLVPYSTHDWGAEHALALLPDTEKAWLVPHKKLYRLGTEAPDNNDIPTSCGAPNTGYDDRRRGHSVEWSADGSDFKAAASGNGLKDRAARRAQEEYGKAVTASGLGLSGRGPRSLTYSFSLFGSKLRRFGVQGA